MTSGTGILDGLAIPNIQSYLGRCLQIHGTNNTNLKGLLRLVVQQSYIGIHRSEHKSPLHPLPRTSSRHNPHSRGRPVLFVDGESRESRSHCSRPVANWASRPGVTTRWIKFELRLAFRHSDSCHIVETGILCIFFATLAVILEEQKCFLFLLAKQRSGWFQAPLKMLLVLFVLPKERQIVPCTYVYHPYNINT